MLGTGVALPVAFLLSFVSVRILIPALQAHGAVDVPNVRSSHQLPVPRGGGIGIIVGIAGGVNVYWLAGLQMPPWPIFAALGAVAFLGAVEDFGMEIPAGLRLIAQFAAAGAIVPTLGPLERLPFPASVDLPLGVWGLPLTLLWVVGVTNIFNFLDGIDGYAGFQGVVAGAAMAGVGFGWVAGFGVAAAAGCAGFLVQNWHPARIFMGDVGSVTLGFLFAILPLGLGGKSHIGVFVMGMALWFFLADGTFTILRRLRQGEKIWQAHRSHLYQRLTIAGWGHSKVVAAVAGGMVAVTGMVIVGVVSASASIQWCSVGTAVALSVGYWLLVVRAEKVARESQDLPVAGALKNDVLKK